MKNIIFIAYEFPPTNTGGSHRPFRIVKYLSQSNIYPIIITPNLKDRNSFEIIEEKGFKVIRTPYKSQSKLLKKVASTHYFHLTDLYNIGWFSFVEQAINSIISQKKIDAIVVTCPPFSISKLGVKLSKKYSIPLLLDMRDAWSNWVITPSASYLHYLLTRRLEEKMFKNAKKISVTSLQTLKDFKRLHPKIQKEKFVYIPNGYDTDLKKTGELRKGKEKLVLGYVGSFYYTPYQRELMFKKWWQKKPYQYLQYSPRKEDWLYRSPYYFFKALKGLSVKRKDLKDILEVQFIGKIPEWLEKMIRDFELQEIVKLLGVKTHEESLAFQENVDALLITSSKVIGGYDYSIAGKTFEYISKMKPIVSFVTRGAQMEILKKTGLAMICDPDDTKKSILELEKLIDRKVNLEPDIEFINSLHSSKIAEKFAQTIHNLKS